MGNDLRVANAARVSFAKESEYIHNWDADATDYVPMLQTKDAKLISYLATHGHWSPFSHCFLTFRIKAPIFVARQLQKHQVGLAWNEVSRRYVDSDPEFYVPDSWRKRAENVKQGSSSELVDLNEWYVDESYDTYIHRCVGQYNYMLKAGVCPEQARMVLPQSMYTEWFWSGSLYAFARVCKQRLDPHAQLETRQVAGQISNHCAQLFPVSWDALMHN